DRAENLARLLHAQVQHLGYVAALVKHLQRLAVVAPARAALAGHVDVGQKVHLHLDHAIALALFASSTGNVEREATRTIATLPGRHGAGEQLANGREQPRVGRRIAARRTADRRLIDAHDPVEI